MKEISIIIPAHKASRFLGECLNSIETQSHFINNDNFEVLVGVDSCAETWTELGRITPNYRNIRQFWFPQNNGPYIVKNTLAYKSDGEFLIFFDADDIMLQSLVSWGMGQKEKQSVIRYVFLNFYEDSPRIKTRYKGADGAFGLRRETFMKLGGFRPWRCAADTEFQLRAGYAGIECIISDRILFNRRKHGDCLTVRPETNMTSQIRQNYHRQILYMKKRPHKETWIKPILADCIEETNNRQDIREYQEYFKA